MIKYSKDLQSLEIFVNSVQDLVPIDKIKSIKSFSVPFDKEERSYANITEHPYKKKRFVITLKTKVQTFKLNQNSQREFIGHQYEYLAVILDSLAHELSHLVYFDHNHQHFKLQSKIMNRFAKVIKKLNIQNTYIGFDKYKGKKHV